MDGLHPLNLEVGQFGTAEANVGQIESAIARGLQELCPALCQHDGTMVLVGSGPSMPWFVDDIRKERALGRPILAIKGAHDFLCKHGLEPDLFLSVEPRSRVENIQLKNQRTIYLLASRCHPEVFDHLADCRVMLWHTLSHNRESSVMPGRALVGGGSTSGLRAICVAYWMLGFRRMVMYGYDSCLAPDGITKRFTGEATGKIIDVHCGGRKFLCNYAMAQQAQDFLSMLASQTMPDLQLECKGGGLIAESLAELRRNGVIK